jgi:hypothetical protein
MDVRRRQWKKKTWRNCKDNKLLSLLSNSKKKKISTEKNAPGLPEPAAHCCRLKLKRVRHRRLSDRPVPFLRRSRDPFFIYNNCDLIPIEFVGIQLSSGVILGSRWKIFRHLQTVWPHKTQSVISAPHLSFFFVLKNQPFNFFIFIKI